jgi:AcrR family transcriptional regulator
VQTKQRKAKKTEDARERVLQTAETLFNEYGYTSVTVQQIAKQLGIKAASLYYHAPGGKEELFVMVMERGLARHREGIKRALEEAGPDVRSRGRAVIGWFLSQGPLGYLRLLMSDLAGIEPRTAQRLRNLSHESLIRPISRVFEDAAAKGEISSSQPELLAGSLLSMVDGIWYASTMQQSSMSMEDMAAGYIDVLLDGLRPREA